MYVAGLSIEPGTSGSCVRHTTKCATWPSNLRNVHILSGETTTVKILKIGTPEIITIIVLHLEQLDFTVQYCVQKMQTE